MFTAAFSLFTWTAFFGVFLACLTFWRDSGKKMEAEAVPDYTAVYLKDRAKQALHFLDYHAAPNDWFFFGLSDVEVGVDPHQIAEMRGRSTRVLNLGLRGASLDFQKALVREVADLHISLGKRAKVSVIFIPWMVMTPEFANRSGTGISRLGALSLWPDRRLWTLLFSDPVRGLNLIWNRYVLGDIDSQVIIYHIKRQKYPLRFEEPSEVYFRLFSDREFHHRHLSWNPATLGRNDFGASVNPRAVEVVMAQVNSPNVLQAGLPMMEARFGFQSSRILEQAKQPFLEIVKTLQSFSDQVLLIDGGDRLSASGLRSRESTERLKTSFRSLCRESQVTCLDLRDSQMFSESDYFDWIHLNAKGREKLSKALATID